MSDTPLPPAKPPDPNLSNLTVGDQRLTWRQAAEHHDERARRAERLATVLVDLDRCQHGRHEGDVCSGCGGPSLGNPIPELADLAARRLADNPRVPAVALRQVGYGISGDPILIPPRGTAVGTPANWRSRPTDVDTSDVDTLTHTIQIQVSPRGTGTVAVECSCRRLDLVDVHPGDLPDLVDEHLHPTDPEQLPPTPGLRPRGPRNPVPDPRPPRQRG